MAGDWIKVEKATARKPEILRLAESLSIHPDHAFGLCIRFWSWCDDQLTTGHAPGVTNVTMDAVIGHAGFSAALVSVGWLRVRDGSLEVPNFDRHLSDSAKTRGLSGKRKDKQRKSVTQTSRSERDKSVTREEKRRVEIVCYRPGSEIAVPNSVNTPECWSAAESWFRHMDQIGRPDKVPLPNSQAEEDFWREAHKFGHDGFIDAVQYSIAGVSWVNIKKRPIEENHSGKRKHGRANAAATREQSNADAFAEFYRSAETPGGSIEAGAEDSGGD